MAYGESTGHYLTKNDLLEKYLRNIFGGMLMTVGLFLCIDGLDGCGKSTHMKLLAKWLRSQGHEVVATDEPTDGPIGRIIKRMLKEGPKLPVTTEALLFAADRLQHVMGVIKPALKTGKLVLSERYVYSSFAYQSARGARMSWLASINKHVPKPDLAVLIDVPVETSLARMKPTRKLDKFERDLQLQHRVRRNYLRIAKRERLKVVNGARPIDEVQADLRKLVSVVL